jgi:hypothetical protein
VLGREAVAEEMQTALQFIERSASLPRPASGLTPLECVAQALLMSNEFTFVD